MFVFGDNLFRSPFRGLLEGLPRLITLGSVDTAEDPIKNIDQPSTPKSEVYKAKKSNECFLSINIEVLYDLEPRSTQVYLGSFHTTEPNLSN